MEKGDPTVGMGVYATAIFLTNGVNELLAVSAPEKDTYALNLDIMRSLEKR